MIIGTCYRGDENLDLQRVQHDCYGRMIGLLVAAGRDRYLEAQRTVGLWDEIRDRLSRLNHFDHRVVQTVHDMIAANYRFSQDDFGQLPLGEMSYEEVALAQWQNYFEEEIEYLVAEPEFIQPFVKAVAYENSDHGCEAEKQMQRFLARRYTQMIEVSQWEEPLAEEDEEESTQETELETESMATMDPETSAKLKGLIRQVSVSDGFGVKLAGILGHRMEVSSVDIESADNPRKSAIATLVLRIGVHSTDQLYRDPNTKERASDDDPL